MGYKFFSGISIKSIYAFFEHFSLLQLEQFWESKFINYLSELTVSNYQRVIFRLKKLLCHIIFGRTCLKVVKLAI